MTFVKPLQSPEPKNYTDPYADGYDAGMDEDYGTDLYGEDFGDLGEGDMFIEGEDPMGDGGAVAMDLTQVEGEIERLYTLLEDFQGNDTKKAALKSEIDALKKQINKIAFKEGQELQAAIQEMFADMAVIETKITGIDPTTGEEDPAFALSNSIEQTLEAIKNNENLSEESKEEFTEKLEKLLVSLETPGMGDPDMLADQYEQIKEEFEQAALHPSTIMDLADYTGLDAETLEQLFDKHDIDPNNLPTPPDASMAALMNDVLKESPAGALLEEEKSLITALNDQIKANTDAAHAQNQAAQSSDTSQADSINTDPFKFLYDAKMHQDDGSEAIKGVRKEIATEVAKILSSIYGKEITACEDPEKAGMISFDGTDLNVLASGGTGKIDFSQSEPDWPDVNLVEIYVDDEGDGKTSVPSWMREAKYPYHIYDTGGACHSPSGNWNW